MSSPALPGPSQRPPKRQRTPDFEESLQGPSNPAKRLRPSEMSIDDMNRVDALLSVDDGPATVAQRDEPMETDLPMIPTADKGKGRMSDEAPTSTSSANSRSAPDDDSRNQRVVEDLEAELSCGCCAGLVYRPMILQPCQHFFCGSCLKQWIENANSNTCPECRTACTHATASRTIQSIVDLLIRNRPDLQRTENERQQADEICAPCNEIKMPQPKPPNPDALIPQAAARNEPGFDHVARPCPHCLPNNQFGWQCPRPIADPDTDPEHAWNLDDGPPPGHGFCGACSEIHPLNAPGTSSCSLCHTSFCGLSIPHLCVAHPTRNARLPQSLNTLTGLLEAQSESVWEAFEFNDVEIDVLLDWIREGRSGAIRNVFQEILEYVRRSPEGFEEMIRKGVFPIENNSINPLPRGASTSATGTTPPAPLVAQTASSTGPLITPAESSASSAPVISQAPIHAVVSAVPAVPPMNDPSIVVNEAPALTTNDTESPTSARVRPENTRAMIGVDTSMPIPIIAPLIDFTSVTPTGLQLPQIIPAPQAPLSGIPTDEQGALISPIMPVQAPTSSTIPTIADTPSIALPGSITMAAPPPSMAPASIPAPPQPVSAPAASAHTTVSRVCRECALEMFLHEIYPWWARERARVLANMAAAAAAPPPPPPVVSVPVAQDGTDAVVADSSMEAPQSSAVDPAVTEAEQHETQSNAAPQTTDVVQDGDGGDDSDDDEGYVGDSQASGSNDAISMLPSSSSMMVKLPDWVARADCPEGRHCERQKERAHAKEFNHIIAPPQPAPPVPTDTQPQQDSLPTDNATAAPQVTVLPNIATAELQGAPAPSVVVAPEASTPQVTSGVEQSEAMEIDIALTTAHIPAPPGDVQAQPHSQTELDTTMLDSPSGSTTGSSSDDRSDSEPRSAIDEDDEESEVAVAASTTSNTMSRMQPSGPVITPSLEEHRAFPVVDAMVMGAIPPALKPSEVLMDVALIHNSIITEEHSLPEAGPSAASSSSQDHSSTTSNVYEPARRSSIETMATA